MTRAGLPDAARECPGCDQYTAVDAVGRLLVCVECGRIVEDHRRFAQRGGVRQCLRRGRREAGALLGAVMAGLVKPAEPCPSGGAHRLSVSADGRGRSVYETGRCEDCGEALHEPGEPVRGGGA